MREESENQVIRGDLSYRLREMLLEESAEAEIQAIIDAAREIGLKTYTREDAINSLLQEPLHQND